MPLFNQFAGEPREDLAVNTGFVGSVVTCPGVVPRDCSPGSSSCSHRRRQIREFQSSKLNCLSACLAVRMSVSLDICGVCVYTCEHLHTVSIYRHVSEHACTHTPYIEKSCAICCSNTRRGRTPPGLWPLPLMLSSSAVGPRGAVAVAAAALSVSWIFIFRL